MPNIRRTSVIFPEALWLRARDAIHDRHLKGGFTRLLCDALEGYLDMLEKVPIRFDTAWMAVKGRDATLFEKVACYAGRMPKFQMGAAQRDGRKDYFTITGLMLHYQTGQWDRDTARLCHLQQQEWLTRGEPMVEMIIKPPGWEDYGYPGQYLPKRAPPPAAPAAARDPLDWQLNLADCELLGDACTHQAECTAARACVLAEAERAKMAGNEADDNSDIT